MRNEKLPVTEAVDHVRKAIEDRAKWFYLLLTEAKEEGYEVEEFARRAIFEFGCMKADKMTETKDMEEFINQFTADLGEEIFAMEVKELESNKAVMEFNYCPLVEAWKKLGCSAEELDYLCDWAVEGDKGMMSKFPVIELDIKTRLGAGDECCTLVFTYRD